MASDPTVSRTVDALAADVTGGLAAINLARSWARAAAWRLAGMLLTTESTLAGRW